MGEKTWFDIWSWHLKHEMGPAHHVATVPTERMYIFLLEKSNKKHNQGKNEYNDKMASYLISHRISPRMKLCQNEFENNLKPIGCFSRELYIKMSTFVLISPSLFSFILEFDLKWLSESEREREGEKIREWAGVTWILTKKRQQNNRLSIKSNGTIPIIWCSQNEEGHFWNGRKSPWFKWSCEWKF